MTAAVNVAIGLFYQGAVSNPDLTNPLLVDGYIDSSGVGGDLTTSSLTTTNLTTAFPIWDNSNNVNGYTGTFVCSSTPSTSFTATALIGVKRDTGLNINNDPNCTISVSGNGGNVNLNYFTPPTGVGATLSNNILTLSISPFAYGTTISVLYVSIVTADTKLASQISISFGSPRNNMFMQKLAYKKSFNVPPPYKFEIALTYKNKGFPVDVKANGSSGGWYIPPEIITDPADSYNIDKVGGATFLDIADQSFGSNLVSSIITRGTLLTSVSSVSGILLFLAKNSGGDSTTRRTSLRFYINGYDVNFCLPVATGELPPPPATYDWTLSYFTVSPTIPYNTMLFTAREAAVTVCPAIQINIDPSNSFKIDIGKDPLVSGSAILGVQGMQFATAAPIPVCLITDCMVWTSLGLEKIQDLKSSCQLVAVDIEGQEFLAKFNVFVQTPRDGQVDICRHEEDVIVSDHHTILYPNTEIKDNFICPRCLIDKPYTNEINVKSCHHCHIFNIKDHTPVLSMESWLPIEKSNSTLYHVIPEDLINVKGFKVGKRRVLISEITTSDIQLLMSGFVKV